MDLNLSNRQIAQELNLNEDDVQAMATSLREGLVARAPEVVLGGEVEADEVYVVAGHKGNPAAVQKRPKRAAPMAQRRAGPRHAQEREAADSGADPAGRASGPSDASQCSTENHQAHHHETGRQRHPDPYR